MIGYKIEESPILIQTQKRGLIGNFEDIQVVGELKSFKFKAPGEACPVGAISEVEGKAFLNIEKCISCYYCMSVCPEGAIRANPSLINSFIRFFRKITKL